STCTTVATKSALGTHHEYVGPRARSAMVHCHVLAGCVVGGRRALRYPGLHSTLSAASRRCTVAPSLPTRSARHGHAAHHTLRVRHCRAVRIVTRCPDRLIPAHIQRALSYPDRHQQRTEGGPRADPGHLVWHRLHTRSCDRIHAVVLSGGRERRIRLRNHRACTRRRAPAPERRPARHWKVRIPRSLPHLFASLKIAITLAFVGSVIAEIVAGNKGVGNVMVIAGSNFDVPLVFAALLVVAIMGIGMYAVFAVFERRFTARSASGAAQAEYATGG